MEHKKLEKAVGKGTSRGGYRGMHVGGGEGLERASERDYSKCWNRV